MASFDNVMTELKDRAKKIQNDKESFASKVKFVNVMDELRYNASKGRIKPSQIYMHQKHPTLYNWILKYWY